MDGLFLPLAEHGWYFTGFAAAASQESFIVEVATPVFHPNSCLHRLVWQVNIYYNYRGDPVQDRGGPVQEF